MLTALKNKIIREMIWHKIDTVFAFFFGMLGGFIKYMSGVSGMVLLDVGFIGRLLEAGVTALVCGFLGVAGKHSFDWLKKKYFSKKKQKP